MNMDYNQVKERVKREDDALKSIFIGTGIGMTVALLTVIAVLRTMM
jgi:hypothetical protein